jgi:glucosylglycerol 3-phosphatase
VIVYVDSSNGEVKNRQSVKLERVISNENGVSQEQLRVVEGPCDLRDTDEPLTLNVVFPDGYQQYINFFQKTARQRQQHC